MYQRKFLGGSDCSRSFSISKIFLEQISSHAIFSTRAYPFINRYQARSKQGFRTESICLAGLQFLPPPYPHRNLAFATIVFWIQASAIASAFIWLWLQPLRRFRARCIRSGNMNPFLHVLHPFANCPLIWFRSTLFGPQIWSSCPRRSITQVKFPAVETSNTISLGCCLLLTHLMGFIL